MRALKSKTLLQISGKLFLKYDCSLKQYNHKVPFLLRCFKIYCMKDYWCKCEICCKYGRCGSSDLFDTAFGQINQWKSGVKLQLENNKTGAVIITSRKKVEAIKLNTRELAIAPRPYISYLGIMIDAWLNFKQQVEHVCNKASAVRNHLSRLMPNVGRTIHKRKLQTLWKLWKLAKIIAAEYQSSFRTNARSWYNIRDASNRYISK